MNLTTALGNALTGLTASARGASVISSNVANALTEGYARRELELEPMSLGGNGAGVSVVGVTRSLNVPLLAELRLSGADSENARQRAGFLESVEKAIGDPETAGSLSGRINALEGAILQAASRPDSTARLQSVTDAAKALTGQLNALTGSVQQARMDADNGIARAVDTLNRSLAAIDDLGNSIVTARASGRDASALYDQRQVLIDRISAIVPVREVPRQNDQIALYTTGGAVLFDGNPAAIGFTPAGIITADRTLASGALSGLTINGMSISPTDSGVLGGGSLGAMFAIRDELAPDAQASLDSLARDLIERFSSPAVDPTLAPGAPGLFTDQGAAVNPLIEEGLAGRIAINAAVDPAAGGQIWRVRDGIAAAAQGPVGDATLLNTLAGTLGAARLPASGPFIGARSASGLAADVLSGIAVARQEAADRQSYTSARTDTLKELHLADGVDTDAEMQRLLLVEQAYSANARVIQVVDDLLQKLIGL